MRHHDDEGKQFIFDIFLLKELFVSHYRHVQNILKKKDTVIKTLI
jgi:hypothetical protein